MKKLIILLNLFFFSCGNGGGGAITSTIPAINPNLSGPDKVDVFCENPAQADAYPFHAKGRIAGIDYYLICAGSQLAAIDSDPKYLKNSYSLGADIDLSQFYNHPTNPTNQFIIGSSESYPFEGKFFGDGYAINNFIYNTTANEGYCGLFGRLESANIGYFMMTNAKINSTNDALCGTIVGRALSSRMVSIGVYNTNITASIGGGIAGQIDSTTIKDVYASGTLNTLNSSSFIGGIASFNVGPSLIENSFFSGSLNGAGSKGNIFSISPLQDQNPLFNVTLNNVFFNNSNGVLACNSSSTCGGLNIQSVTGGSYFYDQANIPMSNWESGVWDFNSYDFPYLN